jgi:hypothetical protein
VPLDADAAGLAELPAVEQPPSAPPVEKTAGTLPAFEAVDAGEPQSTVEVPLEDRARASAEAAGWVESAPVFDAALPPAAESAPPTPSEPATAVPAPSMPSVPEADSLAGALPPPEEADADVASSVAAEMPVPVDQVEQIARRVVGEMSEKVVREIAWEVIPDLAEALIKREIERLKKELQEP